MFDNQKTTYYYYKNDQSRSALKKWDQNLIYQDSKYNIMEQYQQQIKNDVQKQDIQLHYNINQNQNYEITKLNQRKHYDFHLKQTNNQFQTEVRNKTPKTSKSILASYLKDEQDKENQLHGQKKQYKQKYKSSECVKVALTFKPNKTEVYESDNKICYNQFGQPLHRLKKFDRQQRTTNLLHFTPNKIQPDQYKRQLKIGQFNKSLVPQKNEKSKITNKKQFEHKLLLQTTQEPEFKPQKKVILDKNQQSDEKSLSLFGKIKNSNYLYQPDFLCNPRDEIPKNTGLKTYFKDKSQIDLNDENQIEQSKSANKYISKTFQSSLFTPIKDNLYKPLFNKNEKQQTQEERNLGTRIKNYLQYQQFSPKKDNHRLNFVKYDDVNEMNFGRRQFEELKKLNNGVKS